MCWSPGGAGYIGSVVVEQLIAHGHAAIVYDNLVKGHRAAVAPEARLVEGDLMDRQTLIHAFEEYRIEAVIHMAAESLVGESVSHPHKYFTSNVSAGISLLDAMLTVGIKRLVFSSTAAVYGEPERVPITEDALQSRTNPYGESKLIFERMLRWYDQAYALRSASLRYFKRGGRERTVRRGPRAGDTFDSAGAARGGWQNGAHRDFRRRLFHAGRHLHPATTFTSLIWQTRTFSRSRRWMKRAASTTSVMAADIPCVKSSRWRGK